MEFWNDFKGVQNIHRILGCVGNCPNFTWNPGMFQVVVGIYMDVLECVKGVGNLYGIWECFQRCPEFTWNAGMFLRDVRN